MRKHHKKTEKKAEHRLNFLRSLNAQNGDEKQSVSSSYESKQQLCISNSPWHNKNSKNKDTKELLQSLATTLTHGLSPTSAFF